MNGLKVPLIVKAATLHRILELNGEGGYIYAELIVSARKQALSFPKKCQMRM